MFLEKYEDLYEQIEEEVDCCGVDEQQTDTTDINNPSFDDENEDDSALMLRDSSKNTKNNYLERFNKIFEILRESENGEINQQSGNGNSRTDRFAIHCCYCDSYGPVQDTQELAIQHWNQRHKQPQKPA